MKVQSNPTSAVIILDTAEDINKVFDINWESFPSLLHRDFVRHGLNILKVADFQPNIKEWFIKIGLGDWKHQNYEVDWKIIFDKSALEARVVGSLIFKDPKYATLFRLAWN